MNNSWDKLDQSQEPTMEMIEGFVQFSLWDELCRHIETTYKTIPSISYSGCKMAGDWKGWNVKYRKSGKSLCTLYPKRGYFTVLLVIGERERNEAEFSLPFLTPYLQALYQNTPDGMGQKWLVIEVHDRAVLEDVKKLVAIRRTAQSSRQY